MQQNAASSAAAGTSMNEEDGTKRFMGLIDYAGYMEPKTDRVF